MQATIQNAHVCKYKTLLQEGCVYLIKTFKVSPTYSEYQFVDTTIRSYFLIMAPIFDSNGKIQKYLFQFADLEKKSINRLMIIHF